jgi:hypothetical protein
MPGRWQHHGHCVNRVYRQILNQGQDAGAQVAQERDELDPELVPGQQHPGLAAGEGERQNFQLPAPHSLNGEFSRKSTVEGRL